MIAARRSIRIRLTLWYLLALAVTLGLFGSGVWFHLRSTLVESIDRSLYQDLETLERLLAWDDRGRLQVVLDDEDEEEEDQGEADHSGRKGLHDRGGKPEEDREEKENPLEEEADLENLVVTVFEFPPGHCIPTLLYRSPAARRHITAPALYTGVGHPVSVRLDRGHPFRVLVDDERIGGRAVVIQVARSEKRIREQLRDLLLTQALVLPLCLGLAGIVGYMLARRALAPVAAMTRRAGTLGAGSLDRRLPVANPHDELGRLATTFNALFGRLEDAFERMRTFTADAAHELRTPLTAMRAEGELGLSRSREPAEYREILGSMLEEIGRLTRLADSLLTLSKADAGGVEPKLETFRAGDLVEEIRLLLEPLAEERGQTLRPAGDLDLQVRADRMLTRLALVNLVDNAVKYGDRDSEILIHLAAGPAPATIAVSDSGPGLEPEHLQRLFDRFYRPDPGRSRGMGGTGLGLSIARWALRVQGGDVTAASVPGEGSTFTLVLPAEPGKSA